MATNSPRGTGTSESNGRTELSGVFAPEPDPWANLREAVYAVLSDKFMAFISILLIPIIILPLVIPLPNSILTLFDAGDITIVAFFIVEYGAKIGLAEDRWQYFRAPWHLVDLTVIALSVVTYLPILDLHTAGSLVLLSRLARLPRAFAVAGRTGASRVTTSEAAPEAVEPRKELTIRSAGVDPSLPPTILSWEELEHRLADHRPEWIDLDSIDAEGFSRLSRALGIPEPHLKSGVLDDIHSHVTSVQDVALLFLHSGRILYPKRPEQFLTIKRSGVLIICEGEKVITVSPHGLDLFQAVAASPRRLAPESGFVVSTVYAILALVLTERQSILSDIELEVTKIGGLPRWRLPRDFLARTYELNKEVARLASNLIHIRQILTIIASKRIRIAGLDKRTEEDFQLLQDETQFLSELAQDLTNRIGALIDLYINQESFETNRILKILAVITSVAVIPAVVSGILGQNLLGQPFPIELWQISLAIGLSMAFVIYCFIKLGWLRT